MQLTNQKRLAAKILKCGENRVWVNPDYIDEIASSVQADDIREFMIIPINSITRLGEIARTLKSCSNTIPCSDLLNIVREKYDVEWIYNFALSKHAIQKYISDEKENEHFAFELHHFGHKYHEHSRVQKGEH